MTAWCMGWHSSLLAAWARSVCVRSAEHGLLKLHGLRVVSFVTFTTWTASGAVCDVLPDRTLEAFVREEVWKKRFFTSRPENYGGNLLLCPPCSL